MRFKAVLATAVALLLAVPAMAQDADKIKAELKKHIPEAPVDSVRKVPYGGLYEVLVNGEIFYTDEKASFLLIGSLVDLKSKENVTEQRMRQVNKVNFSELPLDRAIKIVRGNGSRKIAIFEDPNCSYCKRFERDLQGVNDITVYVFLYPILSPDSVEKSKAIWCSADPGKSWIDTMTKEAIPSGNKSCPTPLDKNIAFGRDKKINGTPTIFFEDGERVPGAISMADFEKRLTTAQKAKVSSR
ncbi:MAG TPA: DsbC family protein [Usitatibacter sp.]|nr:DsbC family protein [Usitatibacter sp.]